MEMLSRLAFSLLFAGFVFSTPFSPCPDENGGLLPDPENLTISGCDTQNCVFVKGETYSFSVDAFSDVNSSSILLELNIYYSDKGPDSFTIQEDGCNRLTYGDCPLIETEPFTYSRNITLIPGNQTEDVQTEFILYGENGEVITCFRINNTAVGS